MNKREEASLTVLQGMLSSGLYDCSRGRKEQLAEVAVEIADALLQEVKLTEDEQYSIKDFLGSDYFDRESQEYYDLEEKLRMYQQDIKEENL